MASFLDQFQVSIDSKENIQKVVKYNYLTSLLNEIVKKCIFGLNITNENYDLAVKILKERYANTQMLISSHKEDLVKLNPVKHKNDVKGLRKIYDQLESSITTLNSWNVDEESYGTFLVHLLSLDMLEILKTEVFAKNRWATLPNLIVGGGY